MKKKVSSRESSDLASTHFLETFKMFKSNSEWMRDNFRQDDIDFLAISPNLHMNADTDYRSWVGKVYGISQTLSGSSESWKDFSHVGGMKLRSKYNALVSHLMQDIVANGKIAASLETTPMNDLEEAVERGAIDPSLLTNPEALSKAQAAVLAAFDSAEKLLLDNMAESGIEEVYYAAVRSLCRYGVCALENVVTIESKRRIYRPVASVSEDGESLDILPTPDFEVKELSSSKVISAFNVFLDPEADGDPQSGIGVFKQDRCSLSEVYKFLDPSRGFSVKVLEEILDEYESERSPLDKSAGSSGVSYMDASQESSTKPFQALTFWGQVTRRDLESWSSDSSSGSYSLVRDLVKKLKDSGMYGSNRNQIYDIKAVLLDERLVYFDLLGTADGKRPISYARMIPLDGTNYGFGVFALGREVARSMSRLWSRSVNNELMVGSAMFTVDPRIVDESTLIFKPGAKVMLKPGASALSTGSNNAGVNQLQFSSVSASLLALFDKLDYLIDELTMIPRNLVGIASADRITATEVSQNMSSAQVILLGIRRNFDRDIIASSLEQTYHYLQSRKDLPVTSMADARVKVFGAETFALKIINKQMVQELLQIIPSFAQVSPDLLNQFNWSELVLQVVEGLGFDKSKILNTPQLKSQLDQAQNQVVQLTQQMQQMGGDMEKISREFENLQKRYQETEMRNHQLSAQAKIEARLNLEMVDKKNLQDEVKRLNEKIQELSKDVSEAKREKKGGSNEKGN